MFVLGGGHAIGAIILVKSERNQLSVVYYNWNESHVHKAMVIWSLASRDSLPKKNVWQN